MTVDGLFSLQDQVAVVTGGSRGLGEQMARAFAEAGAHVVIASRKLDRCAEVAADIERTTGRRALAYGLHAGRWDEAEPFVETVYDEFGRCDVLVNNAGMSPLYDRIGDVTEAMFDSVVNLCFKGPFRLAVLFAERMRAAGRGSVINVSSTGSLRPPTGAVPYAGAKAALNAVTEGLAMLYGPEVRVNTLMPGSMRTDVSKAWDMPAAEAAAEAIALRRIGEPPEIVGAALLLASSASSYISGSIVRVDGGIP
ncbi:SDR family NAD(P)-dependent oxidoreductase [uncultured Jatrophihabitans sp.]|uniref:SDR family NAD(P)-dependent oxidoreductase n=1 Tax=uncultured Jatrophihabitans sp. TaxID=1610747 RepID=UPI0035CAB956